ncbi:DNA-deoxyinosine glycosylase [Lysobacter koreensis]|uniref:DNA-deoxyinosine glycosylase n=1 Tax=Lysobacter koreensis TaxID=266122 RepID=A0ABW2YI55_9GAMM
MPTLQGLPPIANADACVLVLGSMPGAASLQAGQYYAHGRNRFWRYMGELVGANPALPYAERVQRLGEAGIAVWDVIGQCRRVGSLDSAIRDETVNDFAEFLASHPRVGTVLFNGAKAEASFMRHALPSLARPDLAFHRLPSTSPANASQSDQFKLDAWRSALQQAGVRLAGCQPAT